MVDNSQAASADSLEYFARFIEAELGIVYSDFNRFQLQDRLHEIVRVQGLKDLSELLRQARDQLTPELRQLILDIATNNETSFFRDPKLFSAISASIIPALIQGLKAGSKVRIWSAASSTGQEAYSLAMLIREQCSDPTWFGGLEIMGTDIATHVLERARQARYSQLEVQRGLAAPLLAKYFVLDGENHWTLRPELRAAVRFEQLNLLGSFEHLGSFDLVFCRNVLIYQSVENKKRIIQKLGNVLRPGGHLVLGAGESLIGLSEAFDSVRLEDAILYRPRAQVPITDPSAC